MRATVVAPSDPILSLPEAKRHLRVEHDDDDAYIDALIEVATGWLDAPDGWLGRALGLKTIDLVVPACVWREDRCLPFPPLVAILTETPASDGRTVTVRYQAGYGFAGEDDQRRSLVPAPIRHAILLMVGHLYAHREAVSGAANRPEQLPLGVDALLSPYRVWAV